MLRPADNVTTDLVAHPVDHIIHGDAMEPIEDVVHVHNVVVEEEDEPSHRGTQQVTVQKHVELLPAVKVTTVPVSQSVDHIIHDHVKVPFGEIVPMIQTHCPVANTDVQNQHQSVEIKQPTFAQKRTRRNKTK